MNPLGILILAVLLSTIALMLVNQGRSRRDLEFSFEKDGYEPEDDYGVNSHSRRQDWKNDVEKIRYELRQEHRKYAKDKFTYEDEQLKKRALEQSTQHFGSLLGKKSKNHKVRG